MTRYVILRILTAIPTLLGVLTITFILVRALPGDPALVLLGEGATEQSVAALRLEMGLDQPLVVQYLEYIARVSVLDLGNSAITRQAVMSVVGPTILPSLILAIAGVLVAVLIGIPAGVISAVRQGSWLDYSVMLFTIGGISFPVFWVGLVAILFFSNYLGLLPATGSGTPGDLVSQLRHLLLPATVLGLAVAAYIARLTRAAMLEVLRQNYVQVAEAMGIRRRAVIMKFAFRNALAPILGVIGVSFAWAIGNAILVEVVFSRAGLGTLILRAVSSRDYQLVQAGVLVLAVAVVIVNLLLDLVYGTVDPRVREQNTGEVR